MDETAKLEWGRRITGELYERWPEMKRASL